MKQKLRSRSLDWLVGLEKVRYWKYEKKSWETKWVGHNLF